MTDFDQARQLLRTFKADAYRQGCGVLPLAGEMAASLGKRVLLVRDHFPGSDKYCDTILQSLGGSRVEVLGVVDGAAPNAPLEDLHRIQAAVAQAAPDLLLSFGGGSTTDAVKAAEVLCSAGGTIDDYFGTGLVTARLGEKSVSLRPHFAIQTAASSSAHLTKYSNITNLQSGQKKLIVDDAVVPARALFDYDVTLGAPAVLTADGALDGMSHLLEVLYGAVGKEHYSKMAEIARAGLRLLFLHLPQALENPGDRTAREALGLGTDLGGYAIMIGGTNGAHLSSFSLTDVLSHGRACAMLNPYYTVFFAPAIQEPLRLVAQVCVEAGLASNDVLARQGRDLGVAVAEALQTLLRNAGVPVALDDVSGFGDAHITRALSAAKNPQLRMKLENMPVPMNASMVDEYMGAVLQAARTGRLDLVRNVA